MGKRHLEPIIGQRLRLRLLTEADLSMTLAWRNQAHIRKWFVHSAVIAWEQHQLWCAHYFARDNDFIFIIEETQAFHRPVGQIALYDIDWERQRGEYGRLMIGEPAAAGRGVAKTATRTLLDYAFGPLGLKEITLEVFPDNAPAIAIYRACGFYETGERNGMKLMMAGGA